MEESNQALDNQHLAESDVRREYVEGHSLFSLPRHFFSFTR